MARRPDRAKVEELWHEAQKRFDDARYSARQKLNTWMERAAFWRGFQVSVRDGVFWIDLDEPSGEEREIQNYVRAFVRAAVASRLTAFPNPEVPAATGNQKSIARARATEKLLKSFVDDDTLSKEELMRCLTWATVTGASWLKFSWDPYAGKPTSTEDNYVERTEVDPETGEEYITLHQETDMFGMPVSSTHREGQIKCEFVDTIDGLPDPTAKRFSEVRYWCHRKLRPIGELEQLFPKDYWGKSTKGRFASGGDQDEGQTERDIISGIDEGRVGDSGGMTESGENHEALVVEYWEKPSPDRPNGLLVVWSGSTLIHIGPCPFSPARLPVVLFLGDNVIPSGLYADGMVEDIIPLQRTLNRIESKKKEWLNRIVNPHVMNPIGSQVDPDQFGEIPGQVIEYAQGFKPSVLEIPNIPAGVFEMAESSISRMKEISSYSDISKGDVPTGVESGRAIAFLRENEQNIREPDMLIYKQAVLDSLRQCLQLAKQFYEDGRMVRTLGDDGSWELAEFKDEDYDWFADLAPEASSGGPNSRALRWAETMEAFQMGLFNDEIPGAKAARRMLGLDHAQRSTIQPESQDRSLARMENLQWLNGEPVNMVREFHDDEVHLEEHNMMRNSPEYLEKTPQEQAMLDQHCMMHEMNLQMKMGIFSGQQQLMEGPPPEPGNVASPFDGGNPVGEEQPETQDQFVDGQQEQGIYPV